MNAAQSTHQYAEAAVSQIPGLTSDHCQLVILQEPRIARVAVGKEKDRKPIDPPPIVELKVSHYIDPAQNFLQSPFFFMSCSLIGHQETPSGNLSNALAGTVVSSLHRLKDTFDREGAFFVFGDLSVKVEGKYHLQFTLFEMRETEVCNIGSIQTDMFQVYPQKHFPGMGQSTQLTRNFSEQGVRLRLRKEPKTKGNGPATDNWVPKHYNKKNPNPTQKRPSGAASDEMTSPGSESYNQHAYGGQNQQMHRDMSHQSRMGYGGSYDVEEPRMKRPRTGSGQAQAQSQSQEYDYQNLASPFNSQGRSFSASQQGSMSSDYNQSYEFSSGSNPQSVLPVSARGPYSTPRMDTNLGVYDYNPLNDPRSMTPLQPHTQNMGEYQVQHQESPFTPIRRQSDSFGAIAERPHMSPTGVMPPPPSANLWARPNPSFSPQFHPNMVRRDSPFDPFGLPNQNISAGNNAGDFSGVNRSIPISGPGDVGLPFPQYQ